MLKIPKNRNNKLIEVLGPVDNLDVQGLFNHLDTAAGQKSIGAEHFVQNDPFEDGVTPDSDFLLDLHAVFPPKNNLDNYFI